MKLRLAPISLVVICANAAAASAADPVTPDLKALAQSAVHWEADAKGRPALFTSRALWLAGVTFATGEVECDILGKSNPRGSNFPGLAFHGVGGVTFECVYFRPFNFRTEIPESVVHAVQYISEPQWPWAKLRAEKTGRPMPAVPAQISNIALSSLLATTGQYEKPITPSLDGDAWFHVRIVIAEKTVSVFIKDTPKPCLEVTRLTDRVGGKIAIWGGDAGEGGCFANLKITPK